MTDEHILTPAPAATCGLPLRSLRFRTLALPSAPVAAPALRPPPTTTNADNDGVHGDAEQDHHADTDTRQAHLT